MDFSINIISLLIVVLQLVIIIMLANGGKKRDGRVNRHEFKRAGAPNGENKIERFQGDRGRRQNGADRKPAGQGDKASAGKAQQDRGVKQQGLGGQDQNQIMKLNAIHQELANRSREQENVRKKLPESISLNGGKDGSSRDNESRSGNRDSFRDRPPRGERSERGDRGQRPERGPRREMNRGERNGIERAPRPERPMRDFDAAAGFMQTSTSGADIAPTPMPEVPSSDVSTVSAVETDLQHGRKFTVKRRQMPQQPEAASDAPETVATAPVTESAAQETTPAVTQTSLSFDAPATESAAPATVSEAPASASAPESQEQNNETVSIQYGR